MRLRETHSTSVPRNESTLPTISPNQNIQLYPRAKSKLSKMLDPYQKSNDSYGNFMTIKDLNSAIDRLKANKSYAL